jgi:hypothetical protein
MATINETKLAQLDAIRLSTGSHRCFEDGGCAMAGQRAGRAAQAVAAAPVRVEITPESL